MKKEENKKKRNIIIAIVILLIILLLLLGWFFLRKPSYDITFETNSTTEVDKQSVKKGDKIERPEDPVREGYDFLGWYLDLDDDEPFDFNTKVDKNIKLYAKWAKKKTGNDCTLTCDEGYTLNKDDCICVKATEETPEVTTPETTKMTLTLSKSKLSLLVGQSATVKATIKPADKTKKVTWKSSNTKVVTVDKNGKITAVGEGTAKVTATVDGITKTVTVTVTHPDTNTLNSVLSAMTPKTIDKAGVNINYYRNGCTITNTSNSSLSGTTIAGGVATKVHRKTSAQTLASTYRVVCGSKSATKTVNHTVPASPYTYTSTTAGGMVVLTVSGGASNFHLLVGNGLYHVAGVGVQYPQHQRGTTYQMVFNNDNNTVYDVRSAE